jgi:hypothetical protein
MRHTCSRRGYLAASILILLLAGCAAPANREAMSPQDFTANKHFPYSLQVHSSGGAQTGAMDSSNIADADLKASIEDAVIRSKLFKSVVQGSGGDYELTVAVTSLTKPIFGGSFTVELETAWTLSKLADHSIVMQKAIQSTGTASMGDAFAGVTRLRMAVERAAQDGIRQGLTAIGKLPL